MKGYSYIWLLLIIIIGAFFFAGGQFITEDLNELGVAATPTPGIGLNGSPAPTASSSEWNISILNKGCSATTPSTTLIDITITNAKDGYILAQVIENGTAKYAFSEAVTIQPTETRLNNPFSQALGFSTNPWKLTLFEGGTKDATGKWTGGIERRSFLGNKTNCPTP